MKTMHYLYAALILMCVIIESVRPTCVLESDFGFKINCAFKKSGLFRVRNLGGIKAHASLGFSLGDELGFEQSLTNLDPSRRRSVSVKNGAPPNFIADTSVRPTVKQEKRGKQNRIMMRPMAPASRPNQAAMDKLSTLHRRVSSTMRPIVVSGPTMETPATMTGPNPTITMAKPMPMGVPPFKPLPPKEDTLKVLPIAASTKKTYTPLQIPQSKGPGLLYQSENYPRISHDQVSKMVSQMTGSHMGPQLLRFTPTPIIVNTPKMYAIPTTLNPFVPMPIAAPPTQALTIIPAPILKDPIHVTPSRTPTYLFQNAVSFQKNNPVSNFVDPVPHQVHDLASLYPVYNTKKVDDYNSITGYGDDTTLKFNKEDINAKIVEIAKAGNISMEAVEAAIALRQQQLLNKYANLPVPITTTTTTTSSTTTEVPLIFQPDPEPEILVPSLPHKPKRNPTTGKVMNAPKEYYPVGYEKNFDDQFQSKVDLPETNFHCGDQKYFPGLYGDEGLGCMVFHVCALTDDGLVMKSFLCPESTLFDQTILKCNWWFYVDCKNTRRLYDTNIPVSKSYQLMKALTFFSSYKKEMQDDGKPKNPEDMEGVKEAISILQNQDTVKPTQINNELSAMRIITPQPYVDERNNHNVEVNNESSPVYRSNRNYSNSSNNSNNRKISAKLKSPDPWIQNSDFKLVTVNADMNFNKRANNTRTSAERNVRAGSAENSSERKHRRRMTLRNSSNNTSTVATVVLQSTTTVKPAKTTTPSVEIIKQEIYAIDALNNTEIRQVKLTDQVENLDKIDPTILKEAENYPPVKRFYRSSAELKEQEMAMVKNEKVQIIRPTPMAKLVGEFQTPMATIAKLDEAILGTSQNTRVKKEAITIVTPERHEIPRSPTNRYRT